MQTQKEKREGLKKVRLTQGKSALVDFSDYEKIKTLIKLEKNMSNRSSDKQKLIEAYREALSSDEKLRDYYSRSWYEAKIKEQYARLAPKWQRMVASGRAKLEIAEEPPELDEKGLGLLREFFTQRLNELEHEQNSEGGVQPGPVGADSGAGGGPEKDSADPEGDAQDERAA